MSLACALERDMTHVFFFLDALPETVVASAENASKYAVARHDGRASARLKAHAVADGAFRSS